MAAVGPHKRIRNEASRRKAETLEQLARALEADPTSPEAADITALSKQVDTLAGLEGLHSPGEQWFRSAWPVGVAVAVLAALWYIHQPSPSIALNVRVTRIVTSVDPGQNVLDVEGVGGLGYLHVDGVASVRSSAGDIDVPVPGALRAVYVEGGVNFDRAELVAPSQGEEAASGAEPGIVAAHANGLTTVELRGFDVTLFANTEAAGRVSVSAGGQVRTRELPFTSLELTGRASPGAAIRLYFAGHEDVFRLPVMRPARISLREEAFDRDGGRVTFSSIEGGSVSIVATGREHELLRGASLILDELDGGLRVSVSEDAVDVTFHGRAGVLALGDDDERVVEDLRPSLAEWLSSDRALALAWSTLLFLAGLAVTVRNSLTSLLATRGRH